MRENASLQYLLNLLGLEFPKFDHCANFG